MKTYYLYLDGKQYHRLLKAGSHNAAEKKARKLFPSCNISVEYTEVPDTEEKARL